MVDGEGKDGSSIATARDDAWREERKVALAKAIESGDFGDDDDDDEDEVEVEDELEASAGAGVAAAAGVDPAASVALTAREEMICLMQAEACRKMQSLFHGQKARAMYRPSKPLHQAVKVTVKADGFRGRGPGYEDDLVFEIDVWNLKTSTRQFRHRCERVSVAADGRLALCVGLLLPGVNEDCVLSLRIRSAESNTTQLDAKLIDLGLALPSGLTAVETQLEIPGLSKSMSPSNRRLQAFYITARAVPHSYCGSVWMSQGPGLFERHRQARVTAIKKTRMSLVNIVVVPRPSAWAGLRRLRQWLFGPSRQVTVAPVAVTEARQQAVAQASLSVPADARQGATRTTQQLAGELLLESAPKDWAWTFYWAALYGNELSLYQRPDCTLAPVCVLSADNAVVTSALFGPSQTCAEFQLSPPSRSAAALARAAPSQAQQGAPGGGGKPEGVASNVKAAESEVEAATEAEAETAEADTETEIEAEAGTGTSIFLRCADENLFRLGAGASFVAESRAQAISWVAKIKSTRILSGSHKQVTQAPPQAQEPLLPLPQQRPVP